MPKKPETAIMVNAIELLRLDFSRLKGYDRLYIGSEFCPNKLPTPEALVEAAKAFRGPLTLATPPLGRGGLDKLAPLLKAAAPAKGKLEVVVNDWGLLRFLKQDKNTRLFLGRMLMVEMREADKDTLDHLCRQYGVAGVEIDDPDAMKNLKDYKGSVHFHYPYRLKSFSRYCSYIRDFNSTPCLMDCGSVFVQMSQRAETYPVFMRGNAYFIPNKPIEHPLVSRLVRSFV